MLKPNAVYILLAGILYWRLLYRVLVWSLCHMSGSSGTNSFLTLLIHSGESMSNHMFSSKKCFCLKLSQKFWNFINWEKHIDSSHINVFAYTINCTN